MVKLKERGKNMLSITKNKDKEGIGWSLFGRSNLRNKPNPILERLLKSFEKELKLRLRQIDSSAENLIVTGALHLTIDNLTNTKLATKHMLQCKDLLKQEVALTSLDEQIENTKAVLQTEVVSQSSRATEIGVRTLNLLFCAKQAIKQEFSKVTPLALTINQNGNSAGETNPKLLPFLSSVTETPRMIISSTLLYQLHHSLFPAERMLVGAGRKNGQNIEIDGIFDVTGKASSGYVKADASRLGRALIVMSETDTHFAFWIHSHPGRGQDMTHPSSTDLNQEAEWLKDYSPNLVNAIVVEDRFISFWGKALDEKRITVEITGTGISRESEREYLYRLEF
jgi:hypothetical protein